MTVQVLSAGSVGSTGELFQPMGDYTMKGGRHRFKPIRGLRDGGADGDLGLRNYVGDGKKFSGVTAANDCGIALCLYAKASIRRLKK